MVVVVVWWCQGVGSTIDGVMVFLMMVAAVVMVMVVVLLVIVVLFVIVAEENGSVGGYCSVGRSRSRKDGERERERMVVLTRSFTVYIISL